MTNMQDSFNKMTNNLDNKGYCVLVSSRDESEFEGLQDHPIYRLMKRIKDSISSNIEGDFLSGRTETPKVVELDPEYIDVPGLYLINEDHIHTQVYVHRGEAWYKLRLNEENVYLR